MTELIEGIIMTSIGFQLVHCNMKTVSHACLALLPALLDATWFTYFLSPQVGQGLKHKAGL